MNPKTFLAIIFASTALAVPSRNQADVQPREALPQRGGGGAPLQTVAESFPAPPVVNVKL